MEHFGGLKDSKTDDRQAVATADQVCEGYASECVRLAGLTEDQHIRDRLLDQIEDALAEVLVIERRRERAELANALAERDARIARSCPKFNRARSARASARNVA
jgi:hypothetical protein